MEKTRLLIIIFLSTLGLALFYWFQIRPAQIKHECSWIEVHENAIPASPGVTMEEVETSKKDHPECKGLTLYSGADLRCFTLIKQYKPPQSAQPAKDWWRKAREDEYKFCLHDKGL